MLLRLRENSRNDQTAERFEDNLLNLFNRFSVKSSISMESTIFWKIKFVIPSKTPLSWRIILNLFYFIKWRQWLLIKIHCETSKIIYLFLMYWVILLNIADFIQYDQIISQTLSCFPFPLFVFEFLWFLICDRKLTLTFLLHRFNWAGSK